VVDIQEKFRDLIHDIDGVLQGTGRLVGFCRQLGIPVLVTEQYPRGLGVTVPEVRTMFREFNPLEKVHFSCALDDGFRTALAAAKRDQVILCGIETHVCVYQTAFDLLRDGKQVVVAADAVSSARAADRALGLQCMRELGAQVRNGQMIMFEILKKAGTPEFKDVAQYLRY